jgi:Mrp family chromosome partitioning ATPase
VLGHAVNQALMVVRMNKTSMDSVDRAVRLLRAANVTVVGMVLTHQQYHVPNYLYKYS